MRKAALLVMPLLLSGCSGFGKFISDTATLPGANPNMPSGSSENMERVRGHSVKVNPILPEGGDVWPGAPPPMPTLQDVANGTTGIDGLSDSDYYRSLTGHGASHGGPVMQDGGSFSAGEAHAVRHGVELPEMPEVKSDKAEKSGKAPVPRMPDSDVIVIPNGDGTSTYIAPDGSVSTRPDTQKTH